MPTYNCEICNFSTRLKGNYTGHLNTFKHKRNLEKFKTNDTKNNENGAQMSTNGAQMSTNGAQMSTNEHKSSTKNNEKMAKFTCDFCDRTFSTKAIMKRHIKHYCKSIKNPEHDDFLQEKIENLEKKHETEKKELYKKIDKLIEKVGNTTNIQNNTLQLNSWGQEDLSHISEDFKTKLLGGPYGMIPKMIEEVHFSDKKPENNNIQLVNKNDNKLKIFSGDKWIYRDKNETINDLVDGKYYILDKHFETIGTNLPHQFSTNYMKFRQFFDHGDKEMIESLKRECELILLNNR